MANATITNEGQVTIPKEIRDYLKLATGSQVAFVIDDEGQVKIIPLNISVETLSGLLHRPGRVAATLEEMESAIQQGISQ
jgi:AbrB family looped-hinge helix DNA binding protein